MVQPDPDRVCHTTGVKVNMSLKGSGEALAQLVAEKANPKTDIWFEIGRASCRERV